MKKLFLILLAQGCVMALWSQGSLQIGPGTYLTSSGGVQIVLENVSVANNGSFKQEAGTGFVYMTGNANVSLSGAGVTTFDELVLAKTPAASLQLLSNIAVLSKVNFSGGLLNLNNSVLDLGSSAILSNESETSRAFTTGTGYVQFTWILNANAPPGLNPGNLGAVITSTANLGSTVIRRGHAVQSGVGGTNSSIRRYYDIIPVNNNMLKATLRFRYFDAELNGITENSLYQWKSKDNVNWDFVGADARDIATNYVEKKAINKFDRFTLAAGTAPTITCPGNMTVSANQSGCKALVSFTASTTGIPSPTVTYMIGSKVITSPTVFPKGTTTVTATAANGVSPNATCSFTVTVVCGPTSSSVTRVLTEEAVPSQLTVSAWPNPSAGYFTCVVKSAVVQPITVRVFDIMGRVLLNRPNLGSESTLYFGHRYLPGIYFVEAQQGRERVTLKMMKLDH